MNIKSDKKNNPCFLCKASEIAKYTINDCLNRGYKIDTPKIQKLLTIMHGEYLAKYEQPLFPEDIEVWECGVAIRKVNNDFKSYLFGITEKQTCYLALLDNELSVINSVIEKYGMKDVFEISEDPRLRYIRDYFFKKIPIIVPNTFII